MILIKMKTWKDVVSKGEGREIGVRDVDGDKGEEVGEGEQKEGEQPGKVQVILISIWYFGFNPLIVGGIRIGQTERK